MRRFLFLVLLLMPGIVFAGPNITGSNSFLNEADLKGCQNRAAEETLSLSQIYPLIESSECEKREFDISL